MALRYEELGRLRRGHVEGVSAVAFSHSGTYLVSAGLKDRTVYIWRVADQKLLHRYRNSTATLSLCWLPDREDKLLCGLHGGSISSLTMTKTAVEVTGFWAHKRPVEHISVRGTLLASGAQNEVSVWRAKGENWERIVELPAPPSSSLNEGSEVLVTSIHWTKSSTHRSLLLVSYMFHGISVFETKSWSVVRRVPLQGPIAHASVNSDGTTMAISNMVSGFDLYNLEVQTPFTKFSHEVAALRTVPVLFVHGGHALLGGSTVGKAHLWNVHNGRLHQTFPLGDANTVMALAANYDPVADRFLIATGIANAGAPASVVIWVARDSSRPLRTSSLACGLSYLHVASIAVMGVAIALLYYLDALRGLS